MQNEVSQRKPFASFVPNGTPPLAFSRVRLVPHLGLTLCVATARLTKSKQAYLFIHFFAENSELDYSIFSFILRLFSCHCCLFESDLVIVSDFSE